MKNSATLYGRQIQVEVSTSAAKALQDRDKPVEAVAHLIFGCMVAKRVWFRDYLSENSVQVAENLRLSFDVVRYANCSLSNIDGGAEPEVFPLQKDKKGYVPDYLFIGFSKNAYFGKFTFDRSLRLAGELIDDTGHELEHSSLNPS